MVRETNYIDTNNNSPQIVQSIVDEKDKFSFSYMLFAFRNFLLIVKKNHCLHFRTKSLPVLRLHSIPSMGPSQSIDGHRWPIDGHRNFFRWASMDHRWPSMGFELSPSAWGQLWSIFGLNISNFNLLSFPFEPEQAFSSLKITYIGALSLNYLKKLKNRKVSIIRIKMRRNRASIAEKTICL